MKQTKYRYMKVIQGNYGYGWDDILAYDTNDSEAMAEMKRDYRDYLDNERNASFRIINRRILKVAV